MVLDHPKSSGAYLSWVPFPYAHEAKIRFKGYPQFFQVSYQQGPGASVGPSADETEEFLRDIWWPRVPAPTSERTIDADHPRAQAEQRRDVGFGAPAHETSYQMTRARVATSAAWP